MQEQENLIRGIQIMRTSWSKKKHVKHVDGLNQ